MKIPVNSSFVKPSARSRNVEKSSVEDGEARKQLPSEDYIKQILSWASVSYAVGFVIVSLHTAKLGLPVIELLHPIYVWVGLPIALVLFFSRCIAQFCMRAGDRAAKDIHLGWKQARSPAILDELQVIEDMKAAARVIPLFFGSALLAPAVLRLIGLKEMLAAERASDPVAFQRSARRFRRIAGFTRVFGAAWSIVGIVVNLFYRNREFKHTVMGGVRDRWSRKAASRRSGSISDVLALVSVSSMTRGQMAHASSHVSQTQAVDATVFCCFA